jgi:hypothetical protein
MGSVETQPGNAGVGGHLHVVRCIADHQRLVLATKTRPSVLRASADAVSKRSSRNRGRKKRPNPNWKKRDQAPALLPVATASRNPDACNSSINSAAPQPDV